MRLTDSVGRFSTTIPPIPHQYDRITMENLLREMKQEINSLAQAVWLLTGATATADRTQPGATNVTHQTTIDVQTHNGKRFVNTAATIDILFNLPKATTDEEFEFAVDAAHDIYLWPVPGERFQLGAVHQAAKLTGVGSLARIGCVSTGVWRIIEQLGTAPAYTGSLLLDVDYSVILDADGSPILTGTTPYTSLLLGASHRPILGVHGQPIITHR